MSIDVPQLDDLEYEELLDRAKPLIAARADEWTDFNPHDPGITILELLAWLTDTHSYELDQITDDHREKYLQLLGVRPTPPQPASVRLDLSPADGQHGRLPAGTRLAADDGSGCRQWFETDHAATVTDARLAAVVTDRPEEATTQTTANDTDGMFYRAFGDEPTVGSTFALGFDSDPFAAEELTLFVDFHDDDLPELPTDTTDPVTFEPSVELVWEYCRQYPADGDAEWESLSVRRDTTDCFYRTGFVTLERPRSWKPTVWGCEEAGFFDHDPGLVWLRCRLQQGGYEVPPQFDAVETNVVAASHRCRHEAALEPVGEGPADLADRTYAFEHAPVLSATVEVDGEQWTEVADFDASGPTDRHYVLDNEAGTVTFGDARRGARPPAGATVRATYVAGGGPAGNVPETATWWFSDGEQSLGGATLQDIAVEPRGAATGGRDAESITEAVDRYRRDLRTPARAVTDADIAAIAERTPGVRIARTAVQLPDEPSAPVTVAVVPYAPPDVERPTPSEGVRAAVQRQLDRHRLLTDRIEVVAPTYVGLTVSASVTVSDRYTGDDQSAIETRLRSYLDPIRGFEGDGWPFGRAVSPADLRAELTALPAVENVGELSVRAVGDASVTADGTVAIDESALCYVADLSIETTHTDAGVGGGEVP